jgi:uncharacterized membrane protein (UPF0182 family)
MPPPPDAPDEPTAPVFSLTSVYVPTNRSNLASFIAADSDATSPSYGQIRILRLPDSTQVQGPSQIANTFAADERIQTQLLPIKQNSQVRYGNLLTLPIGGGLLYVQPVYALREVGQGAYPVLHFVLASFGRNAGYGTTLTEALDDVLDSSAGPSGNGSGEPDEPDSPDEPTPTNETVLQLLIQADQKFAAADEALRSGDLGRFAVLVKQAQELVERARAEAVKAEAESPSGSETPAPSGGNEEASGGNDEPEAG